MPEGINQNLDPEEQKRLKQEQEDAKESARFFEEHPEPVISRENLREAGPEITEFEIKVALFESTHSLEKLHAIVEISSDLATLFGKADDLEDPKRIAGDMEYLRSHKPEYIPEYERVMAAARAIILGPEDQKKFEIRRSAKKDLIPIVAILNALKKETNISPEKYEELNEKKKRLARAVGMINTLENNRVDHKR